MKIIIGANQYFIWIDECSCYYIYIIINFKYINNIYKLVKSTTNMKIQIACGLCSG